MRKYLFALLFIFFATSSFSQQDVLKQKLYAFKDKIEAGDKEALMSIAKYLDDTTFVQEWLGYHSYPNTAREITVRILEENCLFTDDEFRFDSLVSEKKFLRLVQDKNVYFDDVTMQFLITPTINRSTIYELKFLSQSDLDYVDTVVIKHPFPEWYYESWIDLFINKKDPQALKWIASAWYKERSRFNVYYFNDNEFLDLMKKLTHVDIGVPNEYGQITFLYNDDYYAKARLNFLVYWVNHYKDYQWNEKQGCFENISEKPKEKDKEEVLFSFLNKENDSLAFDAFVQLTELDTAKIKQLSKEYEKGDLNRNQSLPIFPYRFLRQITRLTQYCRDNGISYKPLGWVLDSLKKLKSEIQYQERYKLEDSLVERATISDLTLIEYFALVNQAEGDLTYSAGRIIDKAYSRNWQTLIGDPSLLSLYLKKSKLFGDIGIIGNLNKFLRKFENCSKECLAQISRIANTATDLDVREQALKVLSLYSGPISYVLDDPKSWEGNRKEYCVDHLSMKYQEVMNGRKNDDDKKYAIQELFGAIDYSQIGEAIKILRKDTLLSDYQKYSFIENDFGIPVESEDSMAVEDFLTHYRTRDQEKLYKYYLQRNGIKYSHVNGDLMYGKIYDMLKYDVIDAFAGGGGGRRDDYVYLLIKLLEFRFKTRLGYSKKLCSSQGMYSCDCTDQAKAWMNYLKQNKLVYPDKNEPVSISSNN